MKKQERVLEYMRTITAEEVFQSQYYINYMCRSICFRIITIITKDVPETFYEISIFYSITAVAAMLYTKMKKAFLEFTVSALARWDRENLSFSVESGISDINEAAKLSTNIFKFLKKT